MRGILTVTEIPPHATACDPRRLTWTPVDLGIVGAVQMAVPFTVWQGAQAYEGQPGDYLVRTVDGALVPIPKAVWRLLGCAVIPAHPKENE